MTAGEGDLAELVGDLEGDVVVSRARMLSEITTIRDLLRDITHRLERIERRLDAEDDDAA